MTGAFTRSVEITNRHFAGWPRTVAWRLRTSNSSSSTRLDDLRGDSSSRGSAAVTNPAVYCLPADFASAVQRASRDSNLSPGRFRFWGCRRSEPVAMEHVFPVECFCIARQMLTTCMSTRKRAWQRMPLLRSAWAKSLSLGAIPAAG